MSRGYIDQQLEEILIEVERRRRRRTFFRRLAAPFLRAPLLLLRLPRIARRPSSPGQLMLVSLGLLVAAVILRRLFAALGEPLLWIGVVLFFTAFATFFIKPDTNIHLRRWRGRIVDTRPTPWWETLYRWLYGR
ncbi:MAG: hypothetical protein HYX92_03610 [Chloroflexi bacterium]|nr:hypothetical protein [Chloroflexota bacterium]